MKEERCNETATLSSGVRARMEKSFFGSVILKERAELLLEKEKPYERVPTTRDTIQLHEERS